MIKYKTGDITGEDAEALVNTVNCVGAMGRGVALRFREAFPDNARAYARACERKEVEPGRMFVFETKSLANPRYIINFPTKRHWRGKSRMEDIESGLAALAEEARSRGIRSIALPPLGSGLGGLDWREVRPRIEKTLAAMDGVRAVVYEPNGQEQPFAPRAQAPKMTLSRAAVVALIDRYLAGLLDPFVTLLEIHKLMYFMQGAGEPLKLNFQPGRYGPYAENLRHVLKAIEGHLVSGYAGRDAPDETIDLVPGAVADANAFLEERPETRARFARVSDLVEGFESPLGLELLATTHWVASRSAPSPASPEEIIAGVYAWSERKRQFSERQIRIALEFLGKKGWLPPAAPPRRPPPRPSFPRRRESRP